ncbi:MAG: hypothetical protein HY965_00105 [Ignavibacteriales bacterium]|nr:hypothetical protein [Ignavibacteriales bacterium]
MRYKLKNFIFIVFAILFLCTDSIAQIRHSGYFSPEIIVGDLGGKSSVFGGAKAVWVFNNTYGIGGSYYSILNSVESDLIDPLNGEKNITHMNFGGLHFEYFIPRLYGVEHSFEIMCAGGGMQFKARNPDKVHTAYYGGDLLIWMPKYNVQFCISDDWKLSMGFGYRHVTNFRGYYQYNKENISRFIVTLGLRGGNN